VKLPAILLVVILGTTRVAYAQAAPKGDCGSSDAPGEFTYDGFANRPWYPPLTANPRDPHSEVLAWGYSRRFEYMVKEGNHSIWDIGFGKELPIGVWEKGTAGDKFMDCGGWGFGLWAPLSFHMVADLEDETNAVINDDYRIAAAFKLAHGMTRHDMLSVKLQLGHESTHLGDEFTIRAINAYGPGFRRINVSYEYFELGANWDHLFGQNGQQMISVRASGVRTADLYGDRGWYATRLLDQTVIQPSRRNFEPAVGVEYMPQGTNGWRPYLSYEGRWRTVYDYDKRSANDREDRQFSSTVIIGLRDLSSASRGFPDVILRGYYGVNPHGQFRNQRNYWMFGIGLYLRL
jgi:hypothetical protein